MAPGVTEVQCRPAGSRRTATPLDAEVIRTAPDGSTGSDGYAGGAPVAGSPGSLAKGTTRTCRPAVE
jgi:hypothetical protein